MAHILPRSAGRVDAPRGDRILSRLLGFLDADTRARAEMALDLEARGWALLPVAPRSKAPYAALLPKDTAGKPSWALLGAARAEPTTILTWFLQDPAVGIGVICGQASGGLGCIDIDHPALLPKGAPFQPTITGLSPGGNDGQRWHIFVTLDGAMRSSKQPWGELLADGSHYVVVDGEHPNGGRYTWSVAPGDEDLAPLTPELLAALTGVPVTTRRIPIRQAAEEQTDEQGKGLVTIDVTWPSAPAPIPLRPLVGDQLRAWLTDEGFQEAACRVLGLSDSVGKAFRCVLPGHEERRPSAALWRTDAGLLLYHDFHRASDGREWYGLPDVLAARAYGTVTTLRASELVAWSLRLIVDAGYVRPVPVTLPPLPPEASKTTRRVYDGVVRLLGCRWLHTPDTPAPLAYRFLAAWCGVSKTAVASALADLRKWDVIQPTGKCPGAYGKPTTLFLPGKGVN